jgi:hypothetical protein
VATQDLNLCHSVSNNDKFLKSGHSRQYDSSKDRIKIEKRIKRVSRDR